MDRRVGVQTSREIFFVVLYVGKVSLVFSFDCTLNFIFHIFFLTIFLPNFRILAFLIAKKLQPFIELVLLIVYLILSVQTSRMSRFVASCAGKGINGL